MSLPPGHLVLEGFVESAEEGPAYLDGDVVGEPELLGPHSVEPSVGRVLLGLPGLLDLGVAIAISG